MHLSLLTIHLKMLPCLHNCTLFIKFNRDINVIILLLFQLGQKNNRLHMHAHREHVNRSDFLERIAAIH